MKHFKPPADPQKDFWEPETPEEFAARIDAMTSWLEQEHGLEPGQGTGLLFDQLFDKNAKSLVITNRAEIHDKIRAIQADSRYEAQEARGNKIIAVCLGAGAVGALIVGLPALATGIACTGGVVAAVGIYQKLKSNRLGNIAAHVIDRLYPERASADKLSSARIHSAPTRHQPRP